MRKIIFFISILSVYSQDVYRFSLPLKQNIEEFHYCDEDKTYKCPPSETCCPTGLNDPEKFRCCELDKATCCKNGNHCCPESYICSNTSAMCYPNLLTIFIRRRFTPMDSLNTKPIARNQEISDLKSIKLTKTVCPDGNNLCNNESTCCPLSNGIYGCCPVCCSNYCCPRGMTCDLKSRSCRSNVKTLVPSLSVNDSNINALYVLCPDGQSQCSDKQTCCIFTDGTYKCCPMPHATCCSDHIHCCPQNTKCNLKALTCETSNVHHVKLNTLFMPLKSIVCPDGQSQCNVGQTCCPSSDGGYGCCPEINAVCCSDHVHCCPHNTVCNISAGTCDKRKIPLVPYLKSNILTLSLKSVMCPDSKTQCEDGQTCCLSSDGGYGCCPESNGVCCSDHIHCCPHNTVCNISAGTCDKRKIQLVPGIKSNIYPILLRSIVCPNGNSLCEDGQTCCPSNNGDYVCCPEVKGVCCSDHIHCCPYGTVCNISAGTCDERKITLVPSLNFNTLTFSLKSVMCPDGKSQCDDGQTCCLSNDGGYGCCPETNAVCCSDHVHCCPHNTVCNISAGTCDKQKARFVHHVKSRFVLLSKLCADGKTRCRYEETCCFSIKGNYECCAV